MQLVDKTRNIRFILIVVAVLIAIASLLTSNFLIRDLQHEESNNMEVWAEAMKSLNLADENTDLNLVLKVINGNNNIPVIVLDKQGNVQSYRNLNRTFSDADSLDEVKEMALGMKSAGNVIRIYLDIQNPDDKIILGNDNSGVEEYESNADNAELSKNEGQNQDTNSFVVVPMKQETAGDYMEICYDDSLMLKRLSWYPYIQLSVVVIFVAIAIFALFTSMRSEQNKVWVGLSKETAHQLGTPISSLMAWSEVLKESYPNDELIPEMYKDVKRLELIAERFSKIGSIPEPKVEDICALLRRTAEYMDHRTSSKVVIRTHFPSNVVEINLIASLFEWVVENLCKNAVDAMDGTGSIDITLKETDKLISIEVKDTGKGIPKSYFKSVFKPGYTTKKRGWGLGLSLAKRIVEEYHGGHIFVKNSVIGVGTTFRVELPRG